MSTTIDVKALRKRLGWRQRQLAEYLGVERSYISKIENGHPPNGPVSRLLDRLTDETPLAAGQDAAA